jgi:HEAT repeat protein
MITLRVLVLVLASCSSVLGQTPLENAWSTLDTGLKEKSTGKRAKAVRVLGLLVKDSKAAGLAQEALGDLQPDVRIAAAAALGQMGANAAVPALKKALQDAEIAVVLAAANSLVMLRDRSAYEVYFAVLTGQRKTGRGIMAQQSRMLRDPRRMAQFGFAEGIGFVPFAGMGYSAIKAVSKDDISPVRAAAAKMLAADPDPNSGAALVQAAGDKSWLVRTAALDAIAKRSDPKLLAGIASALDDEKDIVRYTAAAAIIHLSNVQARVTAPPATRRPKPSR